MSRAPRWSLALALASGVAADPTATMASLEAARSTLSRDAATLESALPQEEAQLAKLKAKHEDLVKASRQAEGMELITMARAATELRAEIARKEAAIARARKALEEAGALERSRIATEREAEARHQATVEHDASVERIRASRLEQIRAQMTARRNRRAAPAPAPLAADADRGAAILAAWRQDDLPRAKQLARAGAEAGDPESMRYLASLTKAGAPTTAFQWMKKAAEAGNAAAMDGLGGYHEDGIGTGVDWKQARRWYEQAAAAGNADGMAHLGMLFSKGKGVPKHRGTAREWLEKARAAGSKSAALTLDHNLY